MKYYKIISLATILFIGLMLSSCSDNSSNTNNPDNSGNLSGKISFTIDGGQYSNEHIEMNENGGALVEYNGKTTTITFGNQEKNQVVIVGINGTETGKYNIEEDNNSIMLTLSPTNILFMSSGSIVVTSYGAIGELITGTFSGEMKTLENDTYEIKDGSFTATRIN